MSDSNILTDMLFQPKKRHAQFIGDIVIACNGLHSFFFICFYHALGISFKEAKALWECGGAGDKQQRNLLRTVVNLIKEEKLRTEIVWALNAADDIGEFRNTLVHTPVKFNPRTQELSPIETAAKFAHLQRMHLMQSKKLLTPLIDDVRCLELYMVYVVTGLTSDKPVTLPKRPALLALPLLIQEQNRKSPPETKKGRDPQPPPSEG